MSDAKHDLDDIVAGIRTSLSDPAEETAAADRTRRALGLDAASVEGTPATARIERCAGFKARIPAYLQATLSKAEALLLEDHTRDCIPCRRALIAARAVRDGAVPAAAPQARRAARPAWGRWAAAAALAAAVLLAGWGAWVSFGPAPESLKVASLRGAIYRLDGATGTPLAAGAMLAETDRLRTGKDSGAVLVMADGSRIEMRDRTELSMSRGRGGATIRLAGGGIIVEAAKQGKRRLEVVTADAIASVKGTIFNVEAGVAGSRVAVLEGSVRVTAGGQERLLEAGDQMASRPALPPLPLLEQFGWSSNAARYDELARALASLREDLRASVASPGPRTATRLLDATPAGTVVFGAIPNLVQGLGQALQILEQHVSRSPALLEWWNSNVKSDEARRELETGFARLRALGGLLGDEIVFSFSLDEAGRLRGPLVRAEARDPEALDRVFRRDYADLSRELDVRIADGVVALAPRGTLAALEGQGTFAGTPLHRRLVEAYGDGTGWLLGTDLQAILSRAGSRGEPLEPLGLNEARNLIVERVEVAGKVHDEAVLTFEGARHGVASWLAEPGPMGGLEYVSPDATMAASVVLRDPGDAVRELLGWFEANDPGFRDALDRVHRETGLDPVADLADPLGGSLTVALDGPVLPVPSWKLVAEVYDPERIQRSISKLVERANDELRKQGRAASLSLVEEAADGRTWSTLRVEGSPMEAHWTYDRGWLVAGPSRALVQRALQARATGSLPRSPQFQELLPRSSRTSYSALAYGDTARALGSLAGAASAVGEAASGGALALVDARPRIACAWAEPDRIVAASDGEGDISSELTNLVGWLARVGPGGMLRAPLRGVTQEGTKTP